MFTIILHEPLLQNFETYIEEKLSRYDAVWLQAFKGFQIASSFVQLFWS